MLKIGWNIRLTLRLLKSTCNKPSPTCRQYILRRKTIINKVWIKQYTPYIHKRLSMMKVMLYYGDQTTLDDLTQDVIMKAMAKQDKYDPDRGSTITWLSLIINDVVSEMKRKTRDAMTHITKSLDNTSDWADFEEDETIDGHDILAQEDALYADQYSYYIDNKDLIDYHIGRLSPKLSTIVRLKLTEGYSHKEIATTMNISEENSRMMYHRGLQDLKSFVQNG